jgi:hypothetical protein
MTTWQYDREIGWHTKAVEDNKNAFVFVYRTAAGDYAISAMKEGDASGGEVEFRTTLREAKNYADVLISNGTYTELMQSE